MLELNELWYIHGWKRMPNKNHCYLSLTFTPFPEVLGTIIVCVIGVSLVQISLSLSFLRGTQGSVFLFLLSQLPVILLLFSLWNSVAIFSFSILFSLRAFRKFSSVILVAFWEGTEWDVSFSISYIWLVVHILRFLKSWLAEAAYTFSTRGIFVCLFVGLVGVRRSGAFSVPSCMLCYGGKE